MFLEMMLGRNSFLKSTLNFFLSLGARIQILFPAKKFPDGQFYSDFGSNPSQMDIPQFLLSSDNTGNSTNKACIGLFVKPNDLDNISLETIDCDEKAIVICQMDYNSYTSERGLPAVPCIDPNKRRKRNTGIWHFSVFY